jgi:hypothetical protein
MWLGSVLPTRDAAEMGRIASFFRALDTPISPGEVRRQEQDPAQAAIGAATLAVGLLLILAGLFANSPQARIIDALLGLILVGFGSRFLYRARQRKGHPVAV